MQTSKNICYNTQHLKGQTGPYKHPSILWGGLPSFASILSTFHPQSKIANLNMNSLLGQ